MDGNLQSSISSQLDMQANQIDDDSVAENIDDSGVENIDDSQETEVC